MPGLLIFALAAALGSEPPASASPAAAKPAKDELICTYESQPDSHFKKRVCMTKAQRDARAALERQNLQSSQRAFCQGTSC